MKEANKKTVLKPNPLVAKKFKSSDTTEKHTLVEVLNLSRSVSVAAD